MQLATTLTGFRRVVVLAAAVAVVLLVRCRSTAHPGLVIERGSTGCLGSGVIDTFEIAPDGAVTWNGYGMPERRFRLTEAEQQALVHARALRDDDAQPVEFHYWVRIDGGDDVFLGTARGGAVDRLLEVATARYRTEWLAGLGESQLLLAAHVGDRRYRVHIDRDGIMRVKRDGLVLSTEKLDDAERVALYEQLLGTVALPAEAGDMVGRLVVGGAMLPVSLPRGTSARLDTLWLAVDAADYKR